MAFSIIQLTTLAIVGALLLQIIRKRQTVLPKGSKPLPGPNGWPLVGNAFDIPSLHAWLKFKAWADEYGPIYQVKAFGTTIVVISNESIANDLFALRGALYSDRPQLIMTGLVSDNGFLGASGWTEYWRKGRRFAQSMLSSSNIRKGLPKQTLEAQQMVVDLAKEPLKYAYLLERAGAMASINQIYGLTVERGPAEVRHVHEITSYMETIDRVAAPGVYLVEFLPWLLHLPTWLAPFKREAKVLVKRHWDYLAPLVQKQGSPEIPDSFAKRYLTSKEDWGLTDREIVWVLGSIYGGASGTSSTAMQSIILNMCLFPEWQKRMQEEIDEAIGERPPCFDDSDSLPTVRAVIKESMRWRPVLSGGFPHALIKDDVYNGYFIPKGAVLIPNQWAIFRDEQMYPESDMFRPERWLKPGYPTYQEPLTTYPNLKRFAAFGHGRRICPGLEVTEKALFLQVSTLFWACKAGKGKDDTGREIEIPWYDYTGVAISTPRRFKFTLEERVEGRLKMLEDAANTAYAEETG